MTRVVQPEGEIFGRRLRELRSRKAMTQEQLAKASGLTSVYISNVENGFAVPSLTTILRLAIALDCRVTNLTSVFDKQNLRAMFAER